ncbi:ORF44 [Ranid herpesvirus 2]|uniref:ORF44 n=1 Tax=Ranid herpesvirus 2 TaxID=389214 RepID=Q14W62_9VIRU|nr:ORF44 [Ranid herpesvirus 2]ABG25601.1 ORF44 [Ranid herpesvirus 2]
MLQYGENMVVEGNAPVAPEIPVPDPYAPLPPSVPGAIQFYAYQDMNLHDLYAMREYGLYYSPPFPTITPQPYVYKDADDSQPMLAPPHVMRKYMVQADRMERMETLIRCHIPEHYVIELLNACRTKYPAAVIPHSGELRDRLLQYFLHAVREGPLYDFMEPFLFRTNRLARGAIEMLLHRKQNLKILSVPMARHIGAGIYKNLAANALKQKWVSRRVMKEVVCNVERTYEERLHCLVKAVPSQYLQQLFAFYYALVPKCAADVYYCLVRDIPVTPLSVSLLQDADGMYQTRSKIMLNATKLLSISAGMFHESFHTRWAKDCKDFSNVLEAHAHTGRALHKLGRSLSLFYKFEARLKECWTVAMCDPPVFDSPYSYLILYYDNFKAAKLRKGLTTFLMFLTLSRQLSLQLKRDLEKSNDIVEFLTAFYAALAHVDMAELNALQCIFECEFSLIMEAAVYGPSPSRTKHYLEQGDMDRLSLQEVKTRLANKTK